jgi:hypothetical protein
MTRADQHARAARLAHDIGKHCTRGALNVHAGEPVPAAVVGLLARDLYELAPGQRASARFAELARELRAALRDGRLERCTALFAEIDALEPGVRAGDEPAVRRAAALAREIRALLDALAAELNGGEA